MAKKREPQEFANIGLGDTGERVERVQGALATMVEHYPSSISGEYCEVTRACVTRYQVAQGLPATGVVDKRTWTLLLSVEDAANEELSALLGAVP